jgi:enediyne biosynthesis protein E4
MPYLLPRKLALGSIFKMRLDNVLSMAKVFKNILVSLIAFQMALASTSAQVTKAPAPVIPKFIEETDTAGLQSRFEGEDEFMVGGGVATFDCDADGLPEIYVTAGVNKAKFYRNKSTIGGALKLLEERTGLELTNAIGAYPLNIDGDSNTDLVVLRVGEVEVFRGLGTCKFERVTSKWGINTANEWHTAFSATWERGQKWPTLAIGTYIDRTKPEFPWGSCTAGLLFRPNDASNGYQPAIKLEPSYCALSMLFSDWGRNGAPDLRVSNDREFYKGGQEQLWKIATGQSPNLYTEAQGWRPMQIWGMGIASQDIDGDGYPELYLTSMADNKLQKLKLDSAGKASKPEYNDIAYKRGVTAHRPYVGGDIHPSTAWHSQFADVNHDGLADIFIVKGNISTMPDFAALDPNNLLLQQSDGRFFEAGHLANIASVRRGRGGMLADLNGDGLLDMVVVNRWDKAQLWRNLGTGTTDKPQQMGVAGHWLQLRLKQADGNKDAVGAWVEVDLGDAMNKKIIRQELTVGGGHASGHIGWMHFGLGKATSVKVRVQWPFAEFGNWQTLAADGFYVIDKSAGKADTVTTWKTP